MSAKDPEDLIARHEAFLQRGAANRPLVACWVGGYYPAEQFPRGVSNWPVSARLQPEQVSFAPFEEDYEALHRAHRDCDDDFFYVGSAYWGIPWLEAILGCPVSVAEANCRAEACSEAAEKWSGRSSTGVSPMRSGEPEDSISCAEEETPHPLTSPPASAWGGEPGDLPEGPVFDLDDNPWLDALIRFTQDLVAFADGRFPVCPPLLRGPGDAACAMLGGTNFVTEMLDEPENMKRLLAHCGEVRIEVLRRLAGVIPDWKGTHAAGGYPSKLWCRRPVAYHQEDCAALLSPNLFREFILPEARRACTATDVNFIHLHSACLYPVDILLEDRCFDVLEINIDLAGAGPAVPDLIPTLQKIQAAGMPLLLWGECSPDDWGLICRRLDPVGLSLQPMVRSPQTKWRMT